MQQPGGRPAPKRFPLYPFLFAAYPVVYLAQANIAHIEPVDALRALLAGLLGTALVYLALGLILRNRHKAALLTSLAVVLFFSYGHIYTLIKSDAIGDFIYGRHRYLIALFALIVLVVGWLVVRRARHPEGAAGILTAISAVLVLVSLAQVILFEVQAAQNRRASYPEKLAQYKVQSLADQLTPPETLPDIYLIAFDSYPREDFLMKDFGYDNRPFLDWLEGQGFFVPDCQLSNYAITTLSMSSMLQMNYIGPDTYGQDMVKRRANWTRFGGYVVYSPVRKTLEDLGYKVVSIETDFSWINLVDADQYYTLGLKSVFDSILTQKLNPFEQLAIDTTALRTLEWFDKPEEQEPGGLRTDQAKYYRTIKATLDRLDTIPGDLPGPKFTYVHVAAPHWPFVFDQEGNFKRSVKYRESVDEIIYLNKRIQGLVEAIQAESGGEAIILLQADHALWKDYGEDVYQRMMPFSAYYLPGGSEGLYENISTVNVFRVIFNRYFGGNLELLDDISYHSPYEHPYEFTPIRDPKPECQSLAGR
jgi:hypothetical protein